MFAPRSLRRSTSAPGRSPSPDGLGRSSPGRRRKEEVKEAEVKGAEAAEPQIRGCATADGKLDSDSQEHGALRKTLSCSAKGILTKDTKGSVRDVSPTPLPSLHTALGHAASRTLLRESSGPLPYACMSVPTAPVTVPLATLSPPVPYRTQIPSPPVPGMNAMTASRRVFYPRVQPPANWVHQVGPTVKALKFAQHPQAHHPQQAVCSRRTVVWQPGPGGPTLLQSKPVARHWISSLWSSFAQYS